MAFGSHIIVINEDPKGAHIATLCNLHFPPKPKTHIKFQHSPFLISTSFLKHLNSQNMSSLPSNVKDELQKFLKLFILNVILLRSK
jgi:hypothetical protein